MTIAAVGEPDANTPAEIEQLRRCLDKHMNGFMNSGNAAPPPARGMICDIEVEPGTKPIALKFRPIKGQLLHQAIWRAHSNMGEERDWRWPTR